MNLLSAVQKAIYNGFLFLVNPVTWIAGLLAWSIAEYQEVLGSVHSALSVALGAIPQVSYPSSFAYANRFAPLTEGFAVFAGLLFLRVTAIVFRIVKSFIPTIN